MRNCVLTLCAAALFAAVLSVPALAQDDVDGKWRIKEGRYEGSTYEGTVDIKSEAGITKLYWNTAGAEFWGFGQVENSKLYAAWSHAESFGYVFYTIYSDSSLAGSWALSSAPESRGTEHLSGGSISAKSTTWRVSGLNPASSGYQSAYTGTMEMARVGDAYHIVWHVGENTYYGVGLKVENKLIVGWGAASDVFGAVCYTIKNNGLRGSWVTHSGDAVGVENIVRQRD